MSHDDLVAWRRSLHAFPEPGFAEYRTASLVARDLARAGVEVLAGEQVMRADARLGVPDPDALARALDEARANGAATEWLDRLADGMTGVVGIVEGDRPGPTVAMRFDMDALGVAESADPVHLPAALGFRSDRPNVMHACGHDGHVAVGVELARRLAADRSFPGVVKLIFQPAEEGTRGARSMAEAGVVDDVDALVCWHLGAGQPVGTVAPGSSGHLATTKLRVRFRGLAAHAAMAPQRGRNALLAAATAALNIHALPAYPGADTRVNVGRLEAGTASNVVAGEAMMLVESRAAVTEANEGLAAGIERVCLAAAQMYGADATIERTGEAPAFTCDPEAEALVAGAIPGTPNATEAPTFIDHASDDAGVLINRVRELGGVGTYSLIGGGPRSEVHHSAEFDIDERALVIAADLLERLVRTGAGRRRSAPTA